MTVDKEINKENENTSSSEVTSTTDNHTSYTLDMITKSIPLPITGHKLNGNNYVHWSQSVIMFVSGKGKNEYLIGEVVAPMTRDPKVRLLKAENNMVMSWLVNSMTNIEIGKKNLL